MPNSKDLTWAERREFALEQTAKDYGISVGELKRRLALEHEIKRARARGAAEWEIDAIKNCPTDMMRDIVRDHQNEPRGPSQAGASGQVTKVSSNAGLPGTVNTHGWRDATPLGPQPHIQHVDRLMDAQDRKDRADLIQQEARRRAAELKAKGG
jgi:hypothetical protein